MSKIEDPRISQPLVCRLVSNVADAINSVPRDAAVQKVRVFCVKINSWSQQGATQRRAPTSNTATMIRHLWCQSHASHAHVGDLLAITQHRTHCTPLPPARLFHCSIKLCRPTWRVSDPWGPIVALRGEASFSPELSGTYADLLWPAYKSTPDFEGAKLSQFFDLYASTYGSFFSTASRDWLEKASPKRPVLFWVR